MSAPARCPILTSVSTHPLDSPAAPTNPIRYVVRWLGEFVFVTDALAVALLVAGAVIGGINPLESVPMTVAMVLSALVFSVHHVWYARNRYEIEHGWDHNHARERRGF